MNGHLTGALWRLFTPPAETVRMLTLAMALGMGLNSTSVLAADIEVVNKTSIDSGDFPLRVDIENNVIFLRGKFLSRTIAGDKILGGVVLDVVLQGAGEEVLSQITIPLTPFDLDIWFDKPIGGVLPREGGMRSEALRRVIVTAREFDTKASELQRRQKEREIVTRRLEEEEKAKRRDADKAFPETTKVIESRVRESRRFQEPMDALNNWGDPYFMSGVMSPEMRFGFKGPVVSVALNYLPPARRPNRLSFIDIDVVPAPSERRVVEWLGPPIKTERQEYRGRVLVYDGRDAAKLKVLGVWWGSDRLVIRLDGRR